MAGICRKSQCSTRRKCNVRRIPETKVLPWRPILRVSGPAIASIRSEAPMARNLPYRAAKVSSSASGPSLLSTVMWENSWENLVPEGVRP